MCIRGSGGSGSGSAAAAAAASDGVRRSSRFAAGKVPI